MLAGNKRSTAVSHPFEPDQSLLPLMAKLTQSNTSFSVANVTSQKRVSEMPVSPVNYVPVSAHTRVPCKYCGKSNHHFSRCYHKPNLKRIHLKLHLLR